MPGGLTVSTPLHDLDVLCSLADGPEGEARDWAIVRLAVRAPERVRGLPDDLNDAALVMASGATGAVGAVVGRLAGADTEPLVAEHCEMLSSMGLLPGDEVAPALRAALVGDGRAGDLYVGQLLADMGALDGASLAKVARVADVPEAAFAVPPLVVRFATRHGAGAEAARAAVADAPPDEAWAPVFLQLLGAPMVREPADDIEAAHLATAAWLRREAPAVPSAKGSPRRRAQKWVKALLEGDERPVAHGVRALADAEVGPPALWVEVATWAALSRGATSPVDLVVGWGGGEDRAQLAEARRAVGPGDDEALAACLDGPRVQGGPLLLAVDRSTSGSAERFVEAAMAGLVTGDLRSELAGSLILARNPDKVTEFLGSWHTLPIGLHVARLCPTEEVLAALVELPLPGDADNQHLWCRALAEMGDPAVLPLLEQLEATLAVDGVGAFLQRARALLGR